MNSSQWVQPEVARSGLAAISSCRCSALSLVHTGTYAVWRNAMACDCRLTLASQAMTWVFHIKIAQCLSSRSFLHHEVPVLEPVHQVVHDVWLPAWERVWSSISGSLGIRNSRPAQVAQVLHLRVRSFGSGSGLIWILYRYMGIGILY